MIELNDLEHIEKVKELYEKFTKNIEEYRQLEGELHNIRYGTCIRGIVDKFLIAVYKKYEYKDVLNADGDLFYILEHNYKTNTYKCKRIRWDLELSKEIYTIEEWVDYYTNDEGEPEYDGRYFEIKNIEMSNEER